MPINNSAPAGEILLYQTEDGQTRIECRFEDNTLWLSQALLAELFQTTVPNINLHIKNILSEDELTEAATIKDHLIVRSEGARQVCRPVKYYSLDMIIAVGYRVRSPRGTAFRQWCADATSASQAEGGRAYRFVCVDQQGYERNPPKNFAGLAASFTEYQA